MNCYVHRERPAVGICKSCGKGLCEACAAEVPDGLACRNRCEERVRLINRIIDSNPQVYAVANANQRAAMLFLTALGALFTVIAALTAWTRGLSAAAFTGTIGLVFLALGLSRLRAKARFPTLK